MTSVEKLKQSGLYVVDENKCIHHRRPFPVFLDTGLLHCHLCSSSIGVLPWIYLILRWNCWTCESRSHLKTWLTVLPELSGYNNSKLRNDTASMSCPICAPKAMALSVEPTLVFSHLWHTSVFFFQSGTSCFCGDTFGRYGTLPFGPDGCGRSCAGINTTTNCGGDLATTIVATNGKREPCC